MRTTPLTATHPTAGGVDATLPDLGGQVTWESIHRPKAPVGLLCRGCDNGVRAKLSPTGLRFFAHNREEADCPLDGETIHHRLLRAELAADLRDAGWHAKLEVPGNGWRADVLGTAPDGLRRMAWEAQLASTTIDGGPGDVSPRVLDEGSSPLVRIRSAQAAPSLPLAASFAYPQSRQPVLPRLTTSL